MDWAFLPIFSRWTGLKFVEIYEKLEKLKNWKNYRSDAISEEKEGKKAGKLVWNLKI